MSDIIDKAESYVVHLLNEKLDTIFVYHNVAHTQFVVKKVGELADLLALKPEEKEIMLLSAWFHDTGYIESVEAHEEKSAALAKAFLTEQGVDDATITRVTKVIRATRMDYEPEDLLEKIIRDADCAHVGSKNFSDFTALLRKEWELMGCAVLTDTQWLEENVKFLTETHRFYTDEASSRWEKIKGKNLSQVLKKQKKLEEDTAKIKQKKEALAFKKDKAYTPERGIETMFRVTLKNHMYLSNIADTKANILLSVNAIIVSLVLSNLIPKLDNASNTHLIIPTIIFVLFTVTSIVLSILATRPNITSGEFTKADVANKKVNLLFFGNFHKMKLDEFEWAMEEMMKDRDYLYSSMKKDLYFLGLVLHKKYSLLRKTYTVFMVGIIVSVIAFSIAFQFSGAAII